MIAQDFRLHVLDLASGDPLVSPTASGDTHLLPGDILVSMIAVEANGAYVMGVHGIYKVKCN